MTEEAVKEDVIEQEAVVPVQATDDQPQQANSAPKEPEAGSKEYNFRRMEQRLAELGRRNQELENVLRENSQEKIKPEPDELSDLQDDDLITVGQVNKLTQKQAKKIVEEAFAKKTKEALPKNTREQFKDYDQVVTNENIEKLVQEDPDLEHDIKVSKNPYARAYKAIKQASFYRQQTENKANSDRIDANNQKPVSSNTVGKQGALSQANAFASWSDEDLRAEMNSCAKRAASVPNTMR